MDVIFKSHLFVVLLVQALLICFVELFPHKLVFRSSAAQSKQRVSRNLLRVVLAHFASEVHSECGFEWREKRRTQTFINPSASKIRIPDKSGLNRNIFATKSERSARTCLQNWLTHSCFCVLKGVVSIIVSIHLFYFR